MSINVKEIIADGMIELCSIKSLNKISIHDLQVKTGISRQTFYNHFNDKPDLIQFIFLTRIVEDWDASNINLDFCQTIIDAFKHYQQYQPFLKQAFQMNGQNCLRDFMIEHGKNFDLKWHQIHYGAQPMPEELTFAVKYHSAATMSLKITWILNNMPCSAWEMAKNITKVRDEGLSKLFWPEHPDKSPYAIAIAKMNDNQ